MEQILNQFKKGNKDYLIIKALIDAAGESVSRDDLLRACISNPFKRTLLGKPDYHQKQKDMLKHNIRIMRSKIPGFSILWDRKTQGYRLIGL